jgi:hypothetical protein
MLTLPLVPALIVSDASSAGNPQTVHYDKLTDIPIMSLLIVVNCELATKQQHNGDKNVAKIAPSEDHRGSGRIRADHLQEGDIIQHLAATWQVSSEPQYTNSGIEFEVLWLNSEITHLATQTVCFAPEWQFPLVSRQPLAAAA